MNRQSAFYLARQVRELDQRTMTARGISDYDLMCDAGAALYRHFRERFSHCGSPCILAGGGNNGGDGYVFARLARAAGMSVRVLALSDPARLQGAARTAYDDARAAGVETEPFDGSLPTDSDSFVDAMLGTGLDRDVEGGYAKAIALLNTRTQPVLAVDIPSGLKADTGQVLGCAVHAALTVTFIGRKPGLHTGAGPSVCGEVIFELLDAPASVHASETPVADALERSQLAQLLPGRPATLHKGIAGHVLVVGGGNGMAGAARLAGEAALRAGAGKVSVRAASGSVLAIQAGRPELMVAEFSNALPQADVLALGPGLGMTEWARECWQAALSAGLPTVLDADGLNLLCSEKLPLRMPMPMPTGSIITPHPGEAARLLETTVEAVEQDRLAAASRLAEKYDCVAVLKGAGTVIASPGGLLALCPHGSAALATAGSGDVLTGIIAALLAGNLRSNNAGNDDPDARVANAWKAACAGVLAHALAGERLAASDGVRGVIAGDILLAARHVMNVSPGATQ